MRSLKTRAIVLKRMDLGEADRLLTLFSEERGKVRAVNKGARKTLSKLAGHLEPFSLVFCQLQEGRNFYTITSAETEDPFIGIRNQLSKTSLAYYFLEMVDALTVDEEAQPTVFELLKESLSLLELGIEPLQDRFITAAFTLRFLVEMGYRPELFHCVHCHTDLQPDNNTFSAKLGGILDLSCRQEDKNAAKLSSNSIKAMRVIADHPIQVITRLQFDTQLLLELEQVIEQYIRYQTGREMRSAVFIREASVHKFR